MQDMRLRVWSLVPVRLRMRLVTYDTSYGMYGCLMRIGARWRPSPCWILHAYALDTYHHKLRNVEKGAHSLLSDMTDVHGIGLYYTLHHLEQKIKIIYLLKLCCLQ